VSVSSIYGRLYTHVVCIYIYIDPQAETAVGCCLFSRKHVLHKALTLRVHDTKLIILIIIIIILIIK